MSDAARQRCVDQVQQVHALARMVQEQLIRKSPSVDALARAEVQLKEIESLLMRCFETFLRNTGPAEPKSRSSSSAAVPTASPSVADYGFVPQPPNKSEPERIPTEDVPIVLYIDTNRRDSKRRALRAFEAFVEQLGIDEQTDITDEGGSFFRRALGRGDRLRSDEIQAKLANVERAIELRMVQEQQAKVAQIEAETVDRLIEAMSNIDSACIRVGSLVIVKYRDNTGESVLQARSMTSQELRALDRFPEIQKHPAQFFESLLMAINALDAAYDMGPDA